VVTLFGRCQAAALVVNVAEVTDRMCEEEGLVGFAEGGDGFFIVLAGSIPIETSLELAEIAEGLSQLDRSAFLPQKNDSPEEIAPGIAEAPLPASLAGFS
jgi:hypothetical protein